MRFMQEFYPSTHLLCDFYGCDGLTDVDALRGYLIQAAEKSGATLLSCNMHGFGANAGVTGVAMLAESHISIHTWPEMDFAAIDIFMCGAADPERAADELRRLMRPKRVEKTAVARGANRIT